MISTVNRFDRDRRFLKTMPTEKWESFKTAFIENLSLYSKDAKTEFSNRLLVLKNHYPGNNNRMTQVEAIFNRLKAVENDNPSNLDDALDTAILEIQQL